MRLDFLHPAIFLLAVGLPPTTTAKPKNAILLSEVIPGSPPGPAPPFPAES